MSKARLHLLGFLLRHGRIYPEKGCGTVACRRWLTTVRFQHPAQQIVFQDFVDAVTDAEARVLELTGQIAIPFPSWSLAPVVEAVQGQAWGRIHRRRHGGGRGREFPSLRQSASIDGLPPACPLGAFHRHQRARLRDRQGSNSRAGLVLARLLPPNRCDSSIGLYRDCVCSLLSARGETECSARKVNRSRDAARADVSDHIARCRNPRRRHAKLGYDVARCTVARLMKDIDIHGVIQGKPHETTIPDKKQPALRMRGAPSIARGA